MPSTLQILCNSFLGIMAMGRKGYRWTDRWGVCACALCACLGQMQCFQSVVGLVSRCRAHGYSWQSAIRKATVCPSGQQNLWVTQLSQTAVVETISGELQLHGVGTPTQHRWYIQSLYHPRVPFFLCMTSHLCLFRMRV